MHAYHRNLRKQVTLVYRVVAEADGSTERPRKTAVLEQLAVGDSATFGGSFHEPILRGVAEKAKHAFLISTGVGIAPLIGFVEQCVARWGGKKHSATTAAKVGCDLDKTHPTPPYPTLHPTLPRHPTPPPYPRWGAESELQEKSEM